MIARHFCGEARRREAAGAGKAGLSRDGTKQFVRGGERRAVHAFRAGKIEIGFVHRDHFNDGREAREDGSDAIAPLGVFRVMAVKKNCVGAEFPGGAQRHCGMDSVFARFVTGRGNYAALVGTSADDNWFAAQVGAVEKLDGNEEGVHVHVENIRD